MNSSFTPFKLARMAMWRTAGWGFFSGTLLGVGAGVAGGTLHFFVALAKNPPSQLHPAFLLILVPTWFIGAMMGGALGAFLGTMVGLGDGFMLGLLTGMHFYPLADVVNYRYFIRRTALLASPVIAMLCLLPIPYTWFVDYALLLYIPTAIFACGVAWWCVPRFVLWYIYVSKSVDEIIALRHAKLIP